MLNFFPHTPTLSCTTSIASILIMITSAAAKDKKGLETHQMHPGKFLSMLTFSELIACILRHMHEDKEIRYFLSGFRISLIFMDSNSRGVPLKISEMYDSTSSAFATTTTTLTLHYQWSNICHCHHHHHHLSNKMGSRPLEYALHKELYYLIDDHLSLSYLIISWLSSSLYMFGRVS